MVATILCLPQVAQLIRRHRRPGAAWAPSGMEACLTLRWAPGSWVRLIVLCVSSGWEFAVPQVQWFERRRSRPAQVSPCRSAVSSPAGAAALQVPVVLNGMGSCLPRCLPSMHLG
jgi:hypothetical protein